MEDDRRSSDDLVRCVACGKVYDLVRDGADGCTECGSVSWISVVIPPRVPHRSRVKPHAA